MDLASKSGFSTNDSIPPKAIVQFENVTLMVDERMKWERIDEPSESPTDSDAAHDEKMQPTKSKETIN